MVERLSAMSYRGYVLPKNVKFYITYNNLAKYKILSVHNR